MYHNCFPAVFPTLIIIKKRKQNYTRGSWSDVVAVVVVVVVVVDVAVWCWRWTSAYSLAGFHYQTD